MGVAEQKTVYNSLVFPLISVKLHISVLLLYESNQWMLETLEMRILLDGCCFYALVSLN